MCKILLIGYVIFASRIDAYAQVSFTPSGLKGISLNNPTSLEIGPDNRLYVSQQDGTIYAYTIKKNGPNDYEVISTETILLIKNIPNHNDDGTLNTLQTRRQVTGILTAGTATNPVLYVGSSDPRIGGGGSAGDQNLDTNSGIISKLTWNGTSWVKKDVVRGLPRSEENHANNGMALDKEKNILYVAQGGNTNAGAPSNNFAFLTEYALSAAILKIDLTQIETQFGGSYDLPTLDDPTRSNVGDKDVNDPFGGNDGRNQAKLVPGGPVQIHSPGYRNSYDVILTTTPGKEGRIYTIDNGPNGGWGGHPDQEGAFGDPLQTNVTNNYPIGEPGSNGPGPNDAKVNNRDNLHLVSAPGLAPIYGGHPNPIRANPASAGLYWYNNATTTAHFELSPTVDWPPVPLSMANPVEGDFRNPGVNDGALYTWGASTNGLAEYTSTIYFNGAMKGNLLAASFDGNIYRIQLNEAGTAVTNVTALANGFGSIPLDVTTQGDSDLFPGTIWAATYGANNITIFEPVGQPAQHWQIEDYISGSPEARHENAFVEVNGKFYLLGGRGTKNINIYNPITKTWTNGSQPPFQMHHFQAVSFDNKIYVVGAFTGGFPNETPITHVYIYDPDTDKWTQSTEIPINRRRGAAASLVYQNKIYVICGIQNGHVDGWVNWLDVYDPTTQQWTQLADAPRARDHFHAAVINGKIYVASGRRTSQSDVFGNTVSEVDVYNVSSNTWNTLPSSANIPTPRAGTAVTAVDGELYVIGGESKVQVAAHNETEVLSPTTNSWKKINGLIQGRHGTQIINYAGKLYIAAGSGNRGGGPELTTMEIMDTYSTCPGDINDDIIDDDNDGYSNLDETLNGTDPCSAASRPDDFDGDLISDLKDEDDDNDGIIDINDKFAWDGSNGKSTQVPIDYPFLNGDPGFGFFGVGVTGLMINYKDNYLDQFNENDPDLIVGGAAGLFSIPAETGDALSNNQKYAFQFGVDINKDTPPFTIHTRLLGNPFFDGISTSQLGNQSQGIYFGNGDQDNYLKFVLHANNGNPGFQILSEENGNIVHNAIIPVSGILSAGQIDLFIDINPAIGAIKTHYMIDKSSVNIGQGHVVTGNLLDVLQNDPAMAVGIISSSGNSPSFSASWDFIKLFTTPHVNQPPVVGPIEAIVMKEGEIKTIPLVISDPDNDELTVTPTNLPSFAEIIKNLNDYSVKLMPLTGNDGDYNFSIKATDSEGLYGEISVSLTVEKKVVSGMQVTGFVLMNGDTGKDIVRLYDGMILTESELPKKIDIRAEVDPETVGSVQFAFGDKVDQVSNKKSTSNGKSDEKANGKPSGVTDNSVPYTLYGDKIGNFKGKPLTPGSYSIKAIPYEKADAKGSSGASLTLNFSVVNSTSAARLATETETDELIEKLSVVTNPADFEEDFAIFPNPTSGITTVRFITTEKSLWNVTLVSMLGKKIDLGSFELNQGHHELLFNLVEKRVEPGIYLISVNNQVNKEKHFKIVIE